MVFLFVFGPIIHSEIQTYVEVWNAHHIRPQRERPNHEVDIPNDMYTNKSLRQFDWTPDPKLLSQLEEAVSNVSE